MRTLSLVFVFVFSFIAFAFAESPAQRVQFEPARNVSISTVTCSTALTTIPSLRGRKEITIRNTETSGIAYVFISPNTVDIDSAWELSPSHFIRLSIDYDSTVYVSANTAIVLKVIQLR